MLLEYRRRLAFGIRCIEKELSEDPDRKGRHLSEGLWRADVVSLRAYFNLQELSQEIRIVGVLWLGDPTA